MVRPLRHNPSGLSPFGRIKSKNASAILREQQQESELEQLWMDGPAIVNEEEPRYKSLKV